MEQLIVQIFNQKLIHLFLNIKSIMIKTATIFIQVVTSTFTRIHTHLGSHLSLGEHHDWETDIRRTNGIAVGDE
jgi:hypothetical protein